MSGQLQSSRQFLLREEFQGEKLLALVRLGLIALIVGAHSFMYVTGQLPYGIELRPWMILTDAGLLLLAAFLVVDLHVLYRRFRRFYKPHYRYIVASVDIALIIGLIAIFSSVVPAGAYAEAILPLAVLAALLTFISAVRFDPFNSLYLGAAYAVAFGWVAAISEMDRIGPVQPTLFLAASFLLAGGVSALAAWHLRRKIEKIQLSSYLQRFLPNNFVDELTNNPKRWSLGGESRVATVLISDIRGFTHFCEQHPPSEVIDYLNAYLDTMIESVFRNNGTLDKFIGDAIMAVYGAPVASDRHARDAVATAAEMVGLLDSFNAQMETRGFPPIEIGCGIASGEMVAGNIGNSRRMEYTVLGDTVNLAARLEELTKEMEGKVLVSQAVRDAVLRDNDVPSIQFGPTVEASIRGKSNPVAVSSLIIT